MAQHEAVVIGDNKSSLRILHSDLLMNSYVDIGVIDEFGNTQWCKVERNEFVDALRETGVI